DELGFWRREAPGLDHLGHEVGANLYRQFAQLLLRPRACHVVHVGDANGNEEGQHAQGLDERPRGHAPGRHDDELAIAVEAVEDVDGGDEKGNGCDQRHHARNRERGHGEEADHVLALRGHQLDLAQRHGDPNHARERKEDEHERTRGLPKDVPAEHPCPPACPWPALRPFSVDYRFGLSLRTIALANRPRHSLWPIWPIALANRSGLSVWPIALACLSDPRTSKTSTIRPPQAQSPHV